MSILPPPNLLDSLQFERETVCKLEYTSVQNTSKGESAVVFMDNPVWTRHQQRSLARLALTPGPTEELFSD